MYNEMEKTTFIMKSSGINKEDFVNLFKITEPYEKEKGKDLSCFTRSEAKDLFRKISRDYGLNLRRLLPIKRQIVSYIEWVITINGGINAFLMLTPEDMNEYASDIIFYSMDEIDEYIYKSINPSDEAIPYLIFYGATDQEICDITPESFGTFAINTGKRDIYVDSYIHDVIKEACNEYEYRYEYKYDYYDRWKSKCIPLSKTDRSPLKPMGYENFHASEDAHVRVKTKLKHIAKITGGPMFTKRILRNSGIIHSLRQNMECFDLDKDQVFNKDSIKLINDQFQLHCPGSYYKKIYGRYL